MSRAPSDHELDRLLAGLPRQPAPPDFGERLMARLEEPPRQSLARRGLIAAAAAAALLVALLLVSRLAPHPAPGAGERLRAEHRSMMAELEALKASLGPREAPVIYLGGDEQLDLVLDLAPVWGLEPSAGDALPATSGGDDPGRVRTAGERNGGRPR